MLCVSCGHLLCYSRYDAKRREEQKKKTTHRTLPAKDDTVNRNNTNTGSEGREASNLYEKKSDSKETDRYTLKGERRGKKSRSRWMWLPEKEKVTRAKRVKRV